MNTNQNRCVCTIQYRYGGESTMSIFVFFKKGLSMMRREGWVGLEKVRDGDGDWRWEVGDGRW